MNARFAFVFGARCREEVVAYLPEDYEVLGEGMRDGRTFYVISGYDNRGWTLDEYVIPRLAGGLMKAEEVDEEKARTVVACSSGPDGYIGLPACKPRTTTCSNCGESFDDGVDAGWHEINTGHGTVWSA